jgi:glutamine synthetase adenylyltransferase
MNLTAPAGVGMHVDDWETLSAQLASHMASVRRVFNELIGDDEAQSRMSSWPSTGASCGRMRWKKMTPARRWRI